MLLYNQQVMSSYRPKWIYYNLQDSRERLGLLPSGNLLCWEMKQMQKC